MNTTMEAEIVDKFFKLDEEAQQRVRSQILSGPKKEFDMKAWLARGDELREKIKERLGEGNYVDAQELLDEVREERTWPL